LEIGFGTKPELVATLELDVKGNSTNQNWNGSSKLTKLCVLFHKISGMKFRPEGMNGKSNGLEEERNVDLKANTEV